jgi:hypothetical protein
VPTTETIARYLTDDRAQDIIDTAAYGGITYWAIEPTLEEFAGRPEGKRWTIVEGNGVDLFFGGEREVEGVYYLDADDIRQAYAKLLDLDQEYVNREYHGYILGSWTDRTEEDGIETGDIDAGTADIIVQLAALGEIRYS